MNLIDNIRIKNSRKKYIYNLLAIGKFNEDQKPTKEFNFRKLKIKKIEFNLWDLGSQMNF